jgi:hypothetical protein
MENNAFIFNHIRKMTAFMIKINKLKIKKKNQLFPVKRSISMYEILL